MNSSKPMSAFLPEERASGRQEQWDYLSTRYTSIYDAIARLGGSLGCEDQSAVLWSELGEVLQKIANLKACSLSDVALKVQTALNMLDETSDGMIRNLLLSVADDLALASTADFRKF